MEMENNKKYTLKDWLEIYKYKKEEKEITREGRKLGVVGEPRKIPGILRNTELILKQTSEKRFGIEQFTEQFIKQFIKQPLDKYIEEIEITDDKLETFFNVNNSLNKLILNKDNKYFEVLVSNLKLEDEISEIRDNNSKITYRLSLISEDYAASLFHELLTRYTKDIKEIKEIYLLFDSYMGKQKMEIGKKESIPIEDLINRYLYENTLDCLISSVSLKIETNQEIGSEKLEEIINSFSFEYMYSKNKEIILSEDIYEAFGIKNETISNKIVSFHKKDVDIPLEYNSKLINFYRNGIKAEDPYIQYLSYYHILEYHYYGTLENKVANELREKLEDIQNNKVEDVASNIIKTVNKGTKERVVLKSILEENITDNIQNLRKRIIEINDNVSYKTPVNFSNASSINWNESVSNIIDQITNRIYDTRNSLVHSKEDKIEKIYEPWNDEHVKELRKEIPLIRALAELMIKNTGKNINLD